MTKVEIIIKADELISAISKIAAAIEVTKTYQVLNTSTASAESKKDAVLPAVAGEVEAIAQVPVTIEQVRGILAEKSQAGKQPQVKALITKYGAKKLTEVKNVTFFTFDFKFVVK